MPGGDHAQDEPHGLVRGMPDQAERASAEGSPLTGSATPAWPSA
jgi:hypothetical protein